jgi:serine/threonine-protein kinase RsbW
MRSRWEIDLSPGTVTRPRRCEAGSTFCAGAESTLELYHLLERHPGVGRAAFLLQLPVRFSVNPGYGSQARLERAVTSDMALSHNGTTIRLQFGSRFEMLDLVQVVVDHVGRLVAMDEDSIVWMEVAVRESVINAIKHGNRHDESKHVFVEFGLLPADHPSELTIRIRDQGEGFDPAELPDPLAPENLLKASGRGIFFMRNFMDEVDIHRAAQGGTEVCMVKKLTPPA